MDKKEAAFPSEWGFQYGLTKREYFAAMAMQGLLAQSRRQWYDILAKESTQIADALIKALESK